MEAEGEVLGGWDETHCSDGDLDEGVDERSQGGLLAGFGFDEAIAVLGEDAGPEVERVHVLPVVDGLVGFLGGVGDAASEVDGELADEVEARCVGNVLVNAPELGC